MLIGIDSENTKKQISGYTGTQIYESLGFHLESQTFKREFDPGSG